MTMPQGLSRPQGHHRWMTALALLLLGAVVALGLSGWVGGGTEQRSRMIGDAAILQIDGPAVIRNGEYDEYRIAMTARRPIANAVLEIDAAYWREMTINTMIPAPDKEQLRDGVMRFEFGPLAPGESAGVKIDGQVNPHRFGGSDGDFVLLDGRRELVRVRRHLRIIP